MAAISKMIPRHHVGSGSSWRHRCKRKCGGSVMSGVNRSGTWRSEGSVVVHEGSESQQQSHGRGASENSGGSENFARRRGTWRTEEASGRRASQARSGLSPRARFSEGEARRTRARCIGARLPGGTPAKTTRVVVVGGHDATRGRHGARGDGAAEGRGGVGGVGAAVDHGGGNSARRGDPGDVALELERRDDEGGRAGAERRADVAPAELLAGGGRKRRRGLGFWWHRGREGEGEIEMATLEGERESEGSRERSEVCERACFEWWPQGNEREMEIDRGRERR
ncbi:hypothetical protein TRIUR3_35210 [Triticum urartu]|uniref:Uncharacterized protein n=1 Tax=Triticum urartu TaxID=4572 RepID=M8A7S1_TRIUA|nr:hypothetical protein TRIUR3_35210 [Triticum urartu]